jgi:hypothetical protein
MTNEATKTQLKQHRDALAFQLRMLARDVDELRAGRETEPAGAGVVTAMMRSHFHLNHLLLALGLSPIPTKDGDDGEASDSREHLR